MKRNEVFAYVYDFVHFLIERTDNVSDIILFGSVARGEFDEQSDIDLFINTKTTLQVQKAVDAALGEFESVARRTWALRGIALPIKPIVGNLDEPRWAALRRDIISTGITIFGKYKEFPKGLAHNVIFSFSLASLNPKNRVAFIRNLYGYSTKKGKKIYLHKGLLEEFGGFKLSPNAVVVPIEHYKAVHTKFNKSKVPVKVREVWM